MTPNAALKGRSSTVAQTPLTTYEQPLVPPQFMHL